MIDKQQYKPEHAVNFLKYCPHCGSADFVAKSRKEFACRDCGFNFFPNAAAAVACVIEDSDGKIMLTKRARDPWKGCYDLPGGFVDPGESIEEAIHREMKEETGCDVHIESFICSRPNRYIFSGYEVNTTDIAFRCRLAEHTVLRPSDDVSSIEWFSPSDIPFEKIHFPSIYEILKTYIQNN